MNIVPSLPFQTQCLGAPLTHFQWLRRKEGKEMSFFWLFVVTDETGLMNKKRGSFKQRRLRFPPPVWSREKEGRRAAMFFGVVD